MTVLTEDARLLGEDLGEQILSLSDSTARLTNFMTDQAEVNARLEALNKNTVAGFHNRLNGSGSDNLEPL
ncbi:hypothetical protein E4U11_005455 [Claviceps purpurea]|nr:hypothetical protein E4U11_005455 [Claviceps purpurea]